MEWYKKSDQVSNFLFSLYIFRCLHDDQTSWLVISYLASSWDNKRLKRDQRRNIKPQNDIRDKHFVVLKHFLYQNTFLMSSQWKLKKKRIFIDLSRKLSLEGSSMLAGCRKQKSNFVFIDKNFFFFFSLSSRIKLFKLNIHPEGIKSHESTFLSFAS